MKTTNTRKAWAKVEYTYIREGEPTPSYSLQRFHGLDFGTNKRDNFRTVKRAIKNFFTGFTGKGEVIVDYVETGPCIDDFLSEDQQESLHGKIYFNNPRSA